MFVDLFVGIPKDQISFIDPWSMDTFGRCKACIVWNPYSFPMMDRKHNRRQDWESLGLPPHPTVTNEGLAWDSRS